MTHSARARLTIDLDALASNYAVLTGLAQGAEMAPVVKADGYGLGAGEVSRRLWAEGARTFFVARLTEGEALRDELGLQRPATIIVLDGLTPHAERRFLAADLTPALSSLAQAEAAAHLARDLASPWPVALHIDTGMNRQGVSLDQARDLARGDDLKRLDLKLVMSHLGSATEPADPRNGAQLERFRAARALFPGARASLAASAGIFLGPDYRFDLVRPGISLYGGGPEERPDPRLRAVATLEAPILDIREVAAGEMVGYGSKVVVRKPARLAIVGAGYADGVIRAGRRGGYGWLGGAPAPYVFVTMDLIALDIGQTGASIGDPVELLGPNAQIDDLATAAGTVAHECLVRLSGRSDRIYLGSR